MAPSRSSRIGATINPARRSGLSWQSSAAHRLYARAPASRWSGPFVATGLKPAPNGAPILPVAGVGTGEHHLAGNGVVVELLVAGRSVPASAQADLVEAVALLVLAEPLFLELVVTDEVLPCSSGASIVDDALALGELLVEVVEILRVEVVAVHGRIRAGVAVGRDHDVVLHR